MIYDQLRAEHRRKVVNRWKRRKGCVDCGYKANSDALEFDHKPGVKKRHTVASLMFHSWEVIKKEIAKCDIRCANCHAIQTRQRQRRVSAEVESVGMTLPCHGSRRGSIPRTSAIFIGN